jgi:hypothetical protein
MWRSRWMGRSRSIGGVRVEVVHARSFADFVRSG